MQPIDNKSLDILFQAQDQSKKSFVDINKSAISEVKRMGLKVVDRIQNQVANDIKKTELKEESFERTVKEKTRSGDKGEKKNSRKEEIKEELFLVNQASTEILDQLENDLQLKDCVKYFDLCAEYNADKILGKPIECDSLSDETVNLSIKESISEINPININYEEDVSDLDLKLLPFANLKQIAENTKPAADLNLSTLSGLKEVTESTKEIAKQRILDTKLNILSKMTNELNKDIEDMTKSIAQIDLNTGSGVDEILELSNEIEKLSEIKEAINFQIQELEIQIQEQKQTINEHKGLSEEAKTLIESRLGRFIKAYKQLDKEIEFTDKSIAQVKTETEAKLVKEKEISYRSQINQSLEFKDRIEILETKTIYNEDLEKEAKISANENTNLFIGTKFSSKLGQDADSNNNSKNSQQDIVQAIQQNLGVSKATATRSQIIKQAIPMEKLPSFVTEKAQQLPNGVKQDLKLFLNPENMGSIELSVSKEGNALDIKMSFSSEDAMKRVESKLNELRTLLRSRGFETKIELSQTSTDNSSNNAAHEHNHNGGSAAYNQAKEEQKQKYVDRPSWLDENNSSEESSFKETYEGITK